MAARISMFRAHVTPTRARFVLFSGLLLVSTAAPFLREAGMNAFAVAFWRMGLAGLAFAIWSMVSGGVGDGRAYRRELVLGGLLLAAHFALWIKAFDLTDYASNLLLLVSQPVFAAVVGAQLGEKHSRRTFAAVGVAVVGLVIIGGGDFRLGPRAILGDALSLLGSLAITLFYAVTRHARASMPLAPFMARTMVVGALGLLPLLAITGAPLTGYPATSWAWLAALVLVTTIAGHGTMNVAARHVTLFALNLVIVLEPPIGVLMGWPLFGATFTLTQLVGGVLLSVAVWLGLPREQP